MAVKRINRWGNAAPHPLSCLIHPSGDVRAALLVGGHTQAPERFRGRREHVLFVDGCLVNVSPQLFWPASTAKIDECQMAGKDPTVRPPHYSFLADNTKLTVLRLGRYANREFHEFKFYSGDKSFTFLSYKEVRNMLAQVISMYAMSHSTNSPFMSMFWTGGLVSCCQIRSLSCGTAELSLPPPGTSRSHLRIRGKGGGFGRRCTLGRRASPRLPGRE